MFGDCAGGQAAGTVAHEQPEDRQTVRLGQGGESFDGSRRFHSSRNIELSIESQFSLAGLQLFAGGCSAESLNPRGYRWTGGMGRGFRAGAPGRKIHQRLLSRLNFTS